MKRTLAIAAAAIVALAAPAAETETPHPDSLVSPRVSTLRADGSTNTWTQADLADALGLLNRKYWRDMETAKGREEWHGKGKCTIDTNRCIRVWRYEDGFEWTNAWTRTLSKLERELAAASRKAAALAAKTSSAPGTVAAILAARSATTQTVTVTVSP